jgi:hypothetical protein
MVIQKFLTVLEEQTKLQIYYIHNLIIHNNSNCHFASAMAWHMGSRPSSIMLGSVANATQSALLYHEGKNVNHLLILPF